MYLYLPIAEVSVNIFVILMMGVGVGFLSGLFGIGGGFLMTPLLIFMGIPSTVAVATQANQIVASSVSGVLVQMRRKNVDIKMGTFMLAGGLVGSSIGVAIFSWLSRLGQIDLVIKLSYVFFLGAIGSLMLWESINTIFRRNAKKKKEKRHNSWIYNLPNKVKFRRSKLYISLWIPVGIGFFVGILSALMGVGGGFILVPAMIYMLGMPTSVVIGTSLFQTIFTTANITLLQSYYNQTVDVVLAVLLLLGAVIGAQIGTRLGSKMKGEQLRGLLALLVLSVCLKLLYDLTVDPGDPFSLKVLLP